jgi:hypothetical protein
MLPSELSAEQISIRALQGNDGADGITGFAQQILCREASPGHARECGHPENYAKLDSRIRGNDEHGLDLWGIGVGTPIL